MTPLRAKYIRDLVIHGRSKHTQEAYTRYVCDLARYYRRSPELISYEQVTGWLYHLMSRQRALEFESHSVAGPPCRGMGCPLCGKTGIRLVAFTDAAGVLHMIGVGPMPFDSS